MRVVRGDVERCRDVHVVFNNGWVVCWDVVFSSEVKIVRRDVVGVGRDLEVVCGDVQVVFNDAWDVC